MDGTWEVFGDCGASSEVLVPFLGRPWGPLGNLCASLGVLGTLWVSLDVFYGVHRGSLGDGSGNPEVPRVPARSPAQPKNQIEHDLPNLSFVIVR